MRRRQAYPVPGGFGVRQGAGPAGIALRRGRWVSIAEWEKGLLFRYGQLVTALAPGRYRRWGAGFTLRAVDMRPWILTLPTQEVPTADGATVKVTVAAQARVTDPVAFVTAGQDASHGLYLAIQVALREVLAGTPVDALLAGRAELGARLAEAVRGVDQLGLAAERLRLLQQLDGSAGHTVVIGTPAAGAPG